MANQPMIEGGCHCRAIRYSIPLATGHHLLCHCSDCRRHSGAPAVAWVSVPARLLKVEGKPKSYRSSEHGRRHFCPDCGTGLFYSTTENKEMVDVQSATLDNPNAIRLHGQIQLAERLRWMKYLFEVPAHERYVPIP
jgi:hypothetical protein